MQAATASPCASLCTNPVNITVNGAPSGPLTIFGSSQPTSMAQATQSIELGLKFSADVAGMTIDFFGVAQPPLPHPLVLPEPMARTRVIQ